MTLPQPEIMTCNSSNNTSIPSSDKTFTTFGDQDVNLMRNYLTSEKSRRSVRFAPEPILTKKDIARKAGYDLTDPRKKSDYKKGDKRHSSEESDDTMVEYLPQKPEYKFKLDRQTRDKLKERTPIISGHTLEHYYRYGELITENDELLRELENQLEKLRNTEENQLDDELEKLRDLIEKQDLFSKYGNLLMKTFYVNDSNIQHLLSIYEKV